MTKFKRILSLILIFALTVTLFNFSLVPKAKADALITLTVDRDSNLQDKITDTSVVLKWNQVYDAKSYLISYRDYSDDNIGVAKSVYTDSPAITYEITVLVPDIIYDFTIEAKTGWGGTGSTVAADQLKVITSTTFSCSYLPDTVVQNDWDRESGVNPGLKPQWNIPKMWDGSSFTYITDDMINYKVTIGTDKAATNLGIYKINYNGIQYEVFKENIPADTMLSYAPVSILSGRISYEWVYKDPVTGDIVDSAVKPGTIYYMNIIPQFNAAVGDIKYKITPLKSGYSYSPLHIKIGKDSNDNIICTIYRINYDTNGGTGNINFKYEVYSSPDAGFASPTLEGYEYEQYGEPTLPIEIFIPQKDQTSTFYYMALAKSDAMDNIESPIVDYNMAMDAGRPHIPQNVEVDNIEMISGVVSGQTIKSADVTLKWDEPADFEYSKSNLAYYILLSSAQADLTTSEGIYYKEVIDDFEYDIKYRIIKVVNGDSTNIDLSESGYIKYKLSGLDLFTHDDGTPISNDDNYPQQLKLNKIYYIKVFSKRIDSGIPSDYSIPVSFTTPTGALRNPPVPETFNVYEAADSEIRLAWQKTQINLADYDSLGSDYSVYYELYMNDSIDKDSDGSYIKPFVFLGSSDNPLHALFTSGTGSEFNVRYATIEEFLGNDEVTTRFGSKNKPNTTYYFIIRTKLVIDGQPEPRFSDFSQILPVTTEKGEIIQPGDNEKIPIAPADFELDVDSNGNKKVDSYSAIFRWSKLQDNVTYRMIRTLKPVNPNDEIEELQIAQGFDMVEYSVSQSLVPNQVGKYVYTIEGLWPNTVYYFNLRAERQSMENGSAVTLASPWITLPVTTYLVESPDTFELARDNTYDKYRQLKVKWRAKDYFSFELWIRAEDQDQYINWSNINIISEQPANLQGTEFRMYYAVISGLQSNTKYYIKLRNKTSRTENGTSIDDFSKFVGPVVARTEFSQADYDDNERLENEEVIFNDRMQGIKDQLFWVLANTDTKTQIKLRGSKAINTMTYDNTDRFIIDITGLKKNSTGKVIIVPLNVLEHINKNKEVLIIKSGFGEMVIKPMTIDTLHPAILSIKNKIGQSGSSIKDVFLRISINKIDSSSANLSSSLKDTLASDITDFSIEVLGMSKTEENIESLIIDKFSSITSEKLSELEDKSESDKDTPEELEDLINDYIESLEDQLGGYIDTQINGSSYIKETKTLAEATNPVQFRFFITKISPSRSQYSAYYYKDNKWEKVTTLMDTFNTTAIFEIRRPGRIAVFGNQSASGSSNNNTLLGELTSKYDIAELVTNNGTFNGQEAMTLKEMLAVAEKIIGEETNNDTNEVVAGVCDRLGLSSKIRGLSDTHKLTRQETAYVVMKLYALKTGVSLENLKPSKPIYLADAGTIDVTYYKSVIMAVDLKIITPDSSNKILASGTLSKQDGLTILKRLLTLAGEF